MKKILLAVCACILVLASNGFCISWEEIMQGANAQIDTQWNNLAKDMGPIVGGGTYHQAGSLGLLGFDIGIHMPLQKVNSDNLMLKDKNIDSLTMPWIQVEKGLPLKIDLVLRGASSDNLSLVGYGLRYNLVALSILDVSAMYTMSSLRSDFIKASANDLTVLASVNIPIIKPYLGISQISTTVNPGDKAVEATPLLAGMKGTASGTLIEAGLNISPFPFFYLHGGMIVSGGSGYTAGAGLKF